MQHLPTVLLLLCASLAAGCSCRPAIPPDTRDSQVDDTDDSDSPTADTGEPKPCEQPEFEPNGLDDRRVFEMESEACGVFNPPYDIDVWRFELPVDAWLAVHVEADNLGSRARPVVRVQNDDLTHNSWLWRSAVDRDVHLLYPESAGSYSIILDEENYQGGELYFYNLLVTQAKQPVSWNTDELEPNDAIASAQPVLNGDQVFGWLTTFGEADWYALAIPPGKHTVTIDVDAFDYGSALNSVLRIRNSAGEPISSCDPCNFPDGPLGEWDPTLSYVSEGDETIYVKLESESGITGDLNGAGPAYWYLLKLEVAE